MFENIDNMEDLLKARAELVKNAAGNDINAVNNEFQIRKRYIAENGSNSLTLEEIKIEKILECNPQKTSGAVFDNDKLIITLPDFAYAVNGSGKIDKSIYPKDPNTFELYILDNSDIPLFIIT